MRYLKFICKEWSCLRYGRPRVWYCFNTSGERLRTNVRMRSCPTCGTKMRCARIQKSVPKGGVLLGSALARRTNPSRERRKAALESTRKLRRQKELAKRRGIRYFDEEDDDPLGLNVTNDDDYEYAPPPQFNPYMRLTPGGRRRTVRAFVFPSGIHLKAVGQIQITSSHTRSFSSTNQNAVMGAHIRGHGQSLSAWEHAGRTPYTTDRYKSAEWCHLVADCLGGPTAVHNLVAASFAANTEMMAIENLLMGKTHLRVYVEAQCIEAHVAELITYNVYCNKGDHWWRVIDGSNDYFSREDLDELRDSLQDFLSTHKHC